MARAEPAVCQDQDPPGDLIAGTIEPERVPAAPAPIDHDLRQGRYGYGLWVVAPALVAILLAMIFRQVVPALFIGILTGAYMLTLGQARLNAAQSGDVAATAAEPIVGRYADMHAALGGFRYAVEDLILKPLATPDLGYYKVKIVFFTLIIGFAVGVMGRNGGTAGMVDIVAGRSGSQRRGLLTAWLSGLIVFFDDYANAMIIGPTMQSVFDKLRLSRAKLAYIVDTTSAPVASLALIGTWIGAEIGFLNSGLSQLDRTQAPGFLANLDGMGAFLRSLPYRYYAVFILVLTFWICLLKRDFGPMRKSESRALSGDTGATRTEAQIIYQHKSVVPRWWLGLLPILVLVGVTVSILLGAGWSSQIWSDPQRTAWQKVADTISAGGEDISYVAIFYAAWGCAITAMLLTFLARACSIREAGDAGLEGMARMFPAIVILVLAWALSLVCERLQLGQVVSEAMREYDFPVQWMPVAIFGCAALISFATGTSWGTMGILCPMTVTIMAGFFTGMTPEQAAAAEPLFYSAVGAVLAGAIFGDHCSPISDTTVLASLASGCRHEEHVWTQIPYALCGAILAAACGNVVSDVYGQPWYYALGAGALAGLLIVLVLGRRARVIREVALAGAPAVRS